VTVEPAVWVNGERHSATGAHISVYDRGFALADGVFETMRAYGGTVFRLDDHLARLEHGLAALDIPPPPQLREWVLVSVRAIDRGDASMRVTVTRGSGAPGVAPPADPCPTVVVTIAPPPIFPSNIYKVGLTAHVVSGRRSERSMTAGLKTLAYTEAVAALIEARRAGADEALFLDTGDHCSEATSSNLFVWTGTSLATPPVTCGALPGITRAIVLELAHSLGLPASERVVELRELMSAEEAFLTSSLRGIAPLTKLGDHIIGRGVPGALTGRLTAAYTALVAGECGQ
jgi:branched-chain amino acid aminotransferase